MISRIQVVVALAAAILDVVAIAYFLGWLSKTDWLMGHTQGPPEYLFRATAAAGIGAVLTFVWFALAGLSKTALLRSVSRPQPSVFKKFQGISLALLALPTCLVLLVASSELPRAREMQKTELLRNASGETTIPELIAILEHDDSSYRRGIAVKQLGRMGADARDAIPVMIEAMSDRGLRLTVPFALAEIGPPAVPAIAEALNDHPSPRVRRGCIKALSFMDPIPKDAAPALKRATGDSDAEVRIAAADCLGRIPNQSSPPNVAILGKAIAGSETRLKKQAIRSLRKMGPDANQAIPELRTAVHDTEPGIRLDAAYSLWLIEKDSAEVVPVLTELLEVPIQYRYDTNVPAMAASYLGKIGRAASSAVPALTKSLDHPNESVRVRAAKALGLIGPAAKPAVPALVDMATTSNPDLSEEMGTALSTLTRIDPQAALTIIRENPNAYRVLKRQDRAAANMPLESYLEKLRRRQ